VRSEAKPTKRAPTVGKRAWHEAFPIIVPLSGDLSSRDTPRSEPTMTLPRSVADVIAHHVTWELESIDRMYLNLYVPGLTQVLDQPVTGRIFFEEVIRENLDIGRPDQVALIFNRRVTRRTPGRFRTRILTEGAPPRCTSITSDRASSSTIKRAARCAPRPRSTMPGTSASASGSRISPRCGRSAFRLPTLGGQERASTRQGIPPRGGNSVDVRRRSRPAPPGPQTRVPSAAHRAPLQPPEQLFLRILH
jgi:hypothetical protein